MAVKFGLLSYNTVNIGDWIQSLAASRFLPSVDYFVDREHLKQFSSANHEPVKAILNGWYLWNPKNFPPSNDIDPLLVSVCFNANIRNDRFLSKEVSAYLRAHGPIGCRDQNTLAFLKAHDIPAYFSGCLTSTLLGNRRGGKGYILCVDTSPAVCSFVKAHSKLPVRFLTKNVNPSINPKNRFAIAKAYLYLYQNANAVITTNLHAALPSTALGAPVCLITPDIGDKSSDLSDRIKGLEGLFNHFSEKEFLSGVSYDFNNPPANPKEFEKIRDGLVTTCAQFTGFDRKSSIFEADYDPLVETMGCLSDNVSDTERGAHFVRTKALIKILVNRQLHKKDINDLPVGAPDNFLFH